jgi:hypothetical protein
MQTKHSFSARHKRGRDNLAMFAELRQASTSDVTCQIMLNPEMAVLESPPGLGHRSSHAVD